MDLKLLNIEQEAEERKYNPKFLLKSYVSYFKKLNAIFHIEPGEREAYNKQFAEFLAQDDKLLDAFDMTAILKKMIKISLRQFKDIKKGKQPGNQKEYDELFDEFSKKSDYILQYKSDNEKFGEIFKAWWRINKKKIVKKTVLGNMWFDFFTKALSFLLARFIALGIKDPIVNYLSISSGKVIADIIASLLIFLVIDSIVEKIKAYFLWARIKFMHGRLSDLDSYLERHMPDIHAGLERS